jgi:hypothetical protein
MSKQRGRAARKAAGYLPTVKTATASLEGVS